MRRLELLGGDAGGGGDSGGSHGRSVGGCRRHDVVYGYQKGGLWKGRVEGRAKARSREDQGEIVESRFEIFLTGASERARSERGSAAFVLFRSKNGGRVLLRKSSVQTGLPEIV